MQVQTLMMLKIRKIYFSKNPGLMLNIRNLNQYSWLFLLFSVTFGSLLQRAFLPFWLCACAYFFPFPFDSSQHHEAFFMFHVKVHVSLMSMLIFEGGGRQRTWYTCSISALLDMGKKTKPYLPPKQTIDTPGGSSNGNYVICVTICVLFAWVVPILMVLVALIDSIYRN